MIVIKASTNKPCFWCGTTAHVVEAKFKDGTFSGTICKNCLFKKMEEKAPRPADAESNVPE